jgi:protein associated with RNAse G/E
VTAGKKLKANWRLRRTTSYHWVADQDIEFFITGEPAPSYFRGKTWWRLVATLRGNQKLSFESFNTAREACKYAQENFDAIKKSFQEMESTSWNVRQSFNKPVGCGLNITLELK